MAQSENLDVAGPAGRLEAILMHPVDSPQAAAVVCHAHPLHGGMMHFKVVFRAAKALQQNHVAVLRFNFRGVGRSQGAHDYGRGEQDDVRAALDEIERRFPSRPLLLGGFSFGSSMALRVGVREPRVEALFALGVPLSLTPDTPFLEQCRKPRLFVQGQRDVFGTGEQIGEIVAKLPEPKSLVVIPDSDHFFTHHLDRLQAAIAEWTARRPWETA